MIRQKMLRGACRSPLALVCMSLAAGCSDEKGKEFPVPEITTIETSDHGKAQREFEARLAISPTFRSDIRSALIADHSAYRGSSWPSVEEFRDLPVKFKCPVAKKLVDFAEKSGWELVRCELAGPVFFRKMDVEHNCPKPTVLQHFEVMQLSLNADRFSLSNPDRFEQISFLFIDEMPRGTIDVHSDLQAKLVAPLSANELEFSRHPVGQYTGYRIIDRRIDTHVLLWMSDGAVACPRASKGVIVGNGIIGRVSTPLSTYAHVQDLLAESLSIAGEDE